MPQFKMVLRYENPCCEETVVFTASDAQEAMEACRSLLDSNRNESLDLESKNVYCSRRLLSCDLVPRGWREELVCPIILEGHV